MINTWAGFHKHKSSSYFRSQIIKKRGIVGWHGDFITPCIKFILICDDGWLRNHQGGNDQNKRWNFCFFATWSAFESSLQPFTAPFSSSRDWGENTDVVNRSVWTCVSVRCGCRSVRRVEVDECIGKKKKDSTNKLSKHTRTTYCIQYGPNWMSEHVNFQCLRVDPCRTA